MLSRDDLIKELASGTSINDICSKHGISRSTIYRYINKYGIDNTILKDRKQILSLKISADNKRRWQDDEYRKKMTSVLNSNTKDPLIQDRIKKSLKDVYSSEAHKKIISDRSKLMWNDEDFRINASKSSKALWADKSYRHRQIEISKSQWTDMSFRESMSKMSKDKWQDDEYRTTICTSLSNTLNTEEHKNRISSFNKKRWENESYRTKMASHLANMPKTMTKPHAKVCSILDALNIDYDTEYQVGPWVFDIYIKSSQIFIEVQGNYFHNRPQQQSRDKAKETYINKYMQDHTILHIWEHECLLDGYILNKIKYLLNLDIVQNEFDFKDLSVKQICAEEANQFLYDWHYQHHGRSGLSIGCYLEDKLISVAKFSSPGRMEMCSSSELQYENTLELTRFCIHPNFGKKNLSTWFLSRCRKYISQNLPDITHLVTFADTTYNHVGTIYLADNWDKVSVTKPDYFYINKDGWVKHKKTLWNHAKKMKMSEKQYSSQYKYTKVNTKEKYKFIRKVK